MAKSTIRTAILSKRIPAKPVSALSVSRQNQRSPRLPMELIVLIAEVLMENPVIKAKENDDYDETDDNFDTEMLWTELDVDQYERQRTLCRLTLCSKATLTTLLPLLYRSPFFFTRTPRSDENVRVFHRTLNNDVPNSGKIAA